MGSTRSQLTHTDFRTLLSCFLHLLAMSDRIMPTTEYPAHPRSSAIALRKKKRTRSVKNATTSLNPPKDTTLPESSNISLSPKVVVPPPKFVAPSKSSTSSTAFESSSSHVLVVHTRSMRRRGKAGAASSIAHTAVSNDANDGSAMPPMVDDEPPTPAAARGKGALPSAVTFLYASTEEIQTALGRAPRGAQPQPAQDCAEIAAQGVASLERLTAEARKVCSDFRYNEAVLETQRKEVERLTQVFEAKMTRNDELDQVFKVKMRRNDMLDQEYNSMRSLLAVMEDSCKRGSDWKEEVKKVMKDDPRYAATDDSWRSSANIGRF